MSKPTEFVTTFKLHCIIVISDPKSWYMWIYVNIFYLNNLLDEYKYLKTHERILTEEFILK